MVYVNVALHLAIAFATPIAASAALLFLSRVAGGASAGASAPPASALFGDDAQCAPLGYGLCYFALGLLLIVKVMLSTLKSFSELCSVLSPENKPIDLSHIGFWKFTLAYLCYAPLIPAAAAATLASSSIVWSGVRFDIRGGRVMAMNRKDAAGQWYTVPREVSLETTFRAMAAETMANSDAFRR